MAIQSAWFLCRTLISAQDSLDKASILADVGRAYAASWRGHFAGRIHAAAVFAHALMRPGSAALAIALPKRFPSAPHVLRCAQREDQTGSDRPAVSRLGSAYPKLVTMEPRDGGERDSHHNGVDHVLMQNEQLRQHGPDADNG